MEAAFSDCYFKYCTSASIKHILANKTLRFTSISTFNDPFEITIDTTEGVEHWRFHNEDKIRNMLAHAYNVRSFDITSEEIAELKKVLQDHGLDEHTDRLVSAIRHHRVTQKSFKRAGALCLTTDPTNLLMWSHYSDSWKGLVFGFKKSSSIFKNSSCAGVRGPVAVKYVDSIQGVVGATPESRIMEFARTKSMIWEYEQEWRCFRPLNVGDTFATFEFDQSDLKYIILGPMMSKSDAYLCRELVKSFEHTKMLIAVPVPGKYKLDVADITADYPFDLIYSEEPSTPSYSFTEESVKGTLRSPLSILKRKW